MRSLLLALVLSAGLPALAAEPDATAAPDRAEAGRLRTDPKTWSKGGWQSLRWGMGPGDVREILRELATFETAWENALGEDQGQVGYSLRFRAKSLLYERRWNIELSFAGHRLVMVWLTPADIGDAEDERLWLHRAIAGLKEKYGEPSGCERGRCIWEISNTVIWVSPLSVSGGISYLDRADFDAANSRAGRAGNADTDKL